MLMNVSASRGVSYSHGNVKKVMRPTVVHTNVKKSGAAMSHSDNDSTPASASAACAASHIDGP